MGNKQFIDFEGLSGVGKSTIARKVAKRLSAVLIATPPAPYADCRDSIDINVVPDARFYFYISSLIHASTLIKHHISTAHVVSDRYLPSTIAYHRAMGVDTELLFPESLQKKMLVQPDKMFLLECNDETERTRRLNKRGLSFNDKDEIKRRLDSAVLATYRSFNPIIIETADKTEEQVVDEIITHLKI